MQLNGDAENVDGWEWVSAKESSDILHTQRFLPMHMFLISITPHNKEKWKIEIININIEGIFGAVECLPFYAISPFQIFLLGY